MPKHILEIKNIHKHFDDQLVLNGINLDIIYNNNIHVVHHHMTNGLYSFEPNKCFISLYASKRINRR